MVIDVNGLKIEKGDTVAPITGDFKGRVCATKLEEGEGFVCIRAAHRPYSKGVWYAADHVQRLQIAPKRREEAPKLIKNPTRRPTADDQDSTTATKPAKKVAKKSTKKRTGAAAATSKKKSTTKKRTTKKKTTRKRTAAKK